ncbi:MAG TPA: TetR/AcrR family transcriptional regulator [Solirubrobacteraceae bacterium]|jgi:AcrR family transcriptional regulator|nr:TetR/AcrR family transcriptional regulator [Solirubrobacteraceae bacterium]
MNVKSEDSASPGEAERPRTLKADQSEATRAALIAAARELFAARGYADVATEEIVRAAGVTRGALYHHFADKRELFEAVYEEVERNLVEQIAASAISRASDPLAALHAGAEAFLDACEDPAVQRIALLDAPSVLGWERWREIGLRYGFGLVQGTVQAAMDAGLIEPQPVTPLAHLLLGAMDEGAMLVARADDDGTTRAQVGASVARFLDALRPRA